MRGKQGRVQSSVSDKLSVLPPEESHSLGWQRQCCGLTLCSGLSKRLGSKLEALACKFSFKKDQQWELLLQCMGRGEPKDIISNSSCEARACEDGC